MSHYDTLGVARDATPDEIKAAYRQAASRAHPDREGGSADSMKAVNVANDVLSDPERRARYDQTGHDAPPQDSLEVKARATVLQELTGVLTAGGDPIAMARDSVAGKMRTVDQALERTRKKIATLEKLRPDVSVVDGDNLVHMLIDQQLAAAAQEIQTLEAWRPVGVRALEILDQHRFTGERPAGNPLDGLNIMDVFEATLGEMRGRRPRYTFVDEMERFRKATDAGAGWTEQTHTRDEPSGTPPPTNSAEFRRNRWGDLR